MDSINNCIRLWAFIVLSVILCGRLEAQVSLGGVRSHTTHEVLAPSFAITDFDGDERPDLARIEVGQSRYGTTKYSIELRLSGVGLRSVSVIAPTGGLRIEARDVNRDGAVDLLLSSAWQKQLVAIFLNNGHGRFSQVEPTAFPGAFTDSSIKWVSSSRQATAAAVVPPQLRSGMSAEATNLPDVHEPTDSIPVPSSKFRSDCFLISYAGRAPPSKVSHL